MTELDGGIMSFGISLFGIVIFVAYFLPGLLAYSRKHKNAIAIIALNFLLGWTFIGWAIALIWACTDNTKEAKAIQPPPRNVI